jgi:excisionase family DNA binding protein
MTKKDQDTKNQDYDRFLKIDQLSEWLQNSESTIRDWIYKRQIPFKKIGGLIRFNRSEIELWINKGNDQEHSFQK